jgi:uncharacterized membrane protein
MLRRRRNARDQVVEAATAVVPFAGRMADDKKFRHRVMAALEHAEAARRRALPATGMAATVARLTTDDELQRHLRDMREALDKAQKRVRRKKQSHKLRNTLIVVGGTGAAIAAVPVLRHRFSSNGTGAGTDLSTIEEDIEVGVPVSTAYNQWTQFEDFPLFMEGVDHVQQLDDTRLRWVASIGGRRAEWEAKILEQVPDTKITWESLDGRETRGTVSFDKVGEQRTRIRLVMSYRPEGPIEKVGAAAGLDRRRIRGDLERFKELLETRGVEDGAWRGEVESGTTTSTAS